VSDIWRSPRPTARLPRGPLLVSVVLHAAILAAVFTFSFSDRIEEPPRLRTSSLILLAPLPPAVRVAVRVRRAIPRESSSRPTFRRFRTPAVPTAATPRGERVPEPAIDIPRPMLVLLEPRPIAELPAPPLRTDNLTAAVAVTRIAETPAVVRAAGFSGATSTNTRPLGSLRRAGFESASTAEAAAPQGLLTRAGFEDATVTPGAAATRSATTDAPPVTRPVEILAKPKPVYTAEARSRHIEGEVSLQILFSASGQVQVLETVRGLGYGLDQNAIAAAKAIRFRPAERAGVPVDSTAIVHIVFQLAY